VREPTPIVVCPLELERASLARCGLDRLAQLVCTGPGPAAVEAWCAGAAPRGPVILAGLAGALAPALAPGHAGVVTSVIDTDGSRYTPTLAADAAPVLGAVAVADAIVADDPARAELARETGAALVDLESGAFARCAERAGWIWAVVRGISDGPGAPLPGQAAGWTDARGRTRTGRVVLDLAAAPSLLPDLLRLRRTSRAGLTAVAEVLRGVLG